MKPILIPCFISCLALTAAAAAGAANPTPTSASKDFHLFVGVNVSVGVNGKFLDVVGAGNRTVVVMVDHQPREIPLYRAKDMQIRRGLKLTNATAEIADIDGLLTSDAADKEQTENVMNSMALSMTNDMQRDHILGQQVVDTGLVAAQWNAYYSLPNAATRAVAQKAEATLNDDMNRLATQEPAFERLTSVNQDLLQRTVTDDTNRAEGVEVTPSISSSGTQLETHTRGISPGKATGPAAGAAPAASGAGSLAAGQTAAPSTTGAGTARATAPRSVRNAGGNRSDRFDLTFEISAPHPIEHPYIVLITEYTAPQQPGAVSRRVLTKSLRQIGPTPQKVSLYQREFPPGFHLQRYDLLVYSQSQEIATNLSERDVALTRDEAYQYVVLDYIATHKGETKPPAAVLMSPRSDLRKRFEVSQLSETVYVSVDKAGQVESVSLDENGRRPAAGAIADALQDFRFIPALDKGVPSNGRAKLVLADFVQ